MSHLLQVHRLAPGSDNRTLGEKVKDAVPGTGRGSSTTGPSSGQGYTQEGRGVTSGTGTSLHLPGNLLAAACRRPLVLPCRILNSAVRQTAAVVAGNSSVCICVVVIVKNGGLQPGHVQLPASLKQHNCCVVSKSPCASAGSGSSTSGGYGNDRTFGEKVKDALPGTGQGSTSGPSSGQGYGQEGRGVTSGTGKCELWRHALLSACCLLA